MFLTAPIAGRLSRKLDPRVMLAIGFAGFAARHLVDDRPHQGLGFLGAVLCRRSCAASALMMCMVPINNIALGTLPPERLKNASGLFNLTRNLGGAVGLAAINTVLNDRMDLHLARLHESVTWSRAAGAGDARTT